MTRKKLVTSFLHPGQDTLAPLSSVRRKGERQILASLIEFAMEITIIDERVVKLAV